MCWCFPFNISNNKNRKTPSSSEKKRRERPPGSHHGGGSYATAEVQEKRRSRETTRSRTSQEPVTPRAPTRKREEHRSRQDNHHRKVYRSREPQRPELNVQVPHMWYRSVDPESTNSSQEMLLNPRPHRSPHQRQRQPKRSSQGTLRGRGAKRDPPRHSKSKKNLRQEPPQSQRWSLFSAPPPKTPSRRDYQNLESSPRSHRSPRHPTSQYQQIPEPSESQSRTHRSRQHQRQPSSVRSSRSQAPNTSARRPPDRRFAVLAATNHALEDVRREAFAQPSPPPRRERLRRYQGVTIQSATIPFTWDCVSSSQTSGGYASSTQRRHQRR